MKRRTAIVFLTVLGWTTLHAQDDSLKLEVLTASDARLVAVLRADAELLDEIQDDDFVLVQDGLVLNKDEQIARVMAFNAPEGMPSRTVELNSIVFEGNVSILTGVVTIMSNAGGFSSAFTEVWLRKGDHWVAKAAHYSTIDSSVPE